MDHPEGREAVSALLNSAVLTKPDGSLGLRYDKIHLVPFGEYVPFKRLLSFAGKITKEVGDFTPGRERTIFELDGHKVGVFICYESVFPDEIRLFPKRGAEVLVNISNDGWYGESGAPGQHLNMARMRAIENNRWLLRATNNGFTALSIRSAVGGRSAEKCAPRDGRAVCIHLRANVLCQHGDWFAIYVLLVALFALVVRFSVGADCCA